MIRTPSPAGELEFAQDEASRKRLHRQAQAGNAFRIFPTAYIVGASLPPERCVKLHLGEILAAVWPGGVLCGQTALQNGEPRDGHLFIARAGDQRRTPLVVGAYTITPVNAPGNLPGDFDYPPGLYLSGDARRLVENMPTAGRPGAHVAGREAVENALESMARRGAPHVAKIRTELNVIAGSFDQSAVRRVRELLDAVEGTARPTQRPQSARLAARLGGRPYDQRVLNLVSSVLTTLESQAPIAVPAPSIAGRDAWLPFFEAYFSNYIEGTTFTIDEALRIIVDEEVPAGRPKDAHDVSSTYLLITGPERSEVPEHAGEFIDILQSRHAVLMASRPEKRPGEIKDEDNRVGDYIFTSSELVRGTLEEGFGLIAPLFDPFARAVAMSVLLTECHPFDDGNGRVSRMMANAELSNRGYGRIIIPTVFRGNYLSALSAQSRGTGAGQQLIAVLAFAQKWTAAVDWSTFERSDAQMHDTHAYLESIVADGQGLRLTMPDGIR